MDFSLSEQQVLLQDSAQRYIDREYGADQRARIAESERGYSARNWQMMCDLGWTGLGIPTSVSGQGGSIVDVMLLCEILGQGPIVEPFQAGFWAAQLLAGCDAVRAAACLREQLNGQRLYVPALYEPGRRYGIDSRNTTATRVDGQFRLQGARSGVPFGKWADGFILQALLDDGSAALFLVPSDSLGLTISPYRTLDGHQAAELVMKDVILPKDSLLASGGDVPGLLERALDSALIALCAEGLGAMETVLAMTVEYCKQRKQFGVHIGSFQALQHKLVDMFIQCEGVRSLLYAAAIKHAEGDPGARNLTAALKYKVSKDGRSLSEQAVQLHGAIGFTEELALSRYYKRLLCIGSTCGDADNQLQTYINISKTDRNRDSGIGVHPYSFISGD